MLSNDFIFDEYYLDSKKLRRGSTEADSMLLDTRLQKLMSLRSALSNGKGNRTSSWKYAAKEYPELVHNLLEKDIDLDNVFVISITETAEFYIKTQGSKIQSLTPMVKGDVIVGWL